VWSGNVARGIETRGKVKNGNREQIKGKREFFKGVK
jgi:hypothetical protein